MNLLNILIFSGSVLSIFMAVYKIFDAQGYVISLYKPEFYLRQEMLKSQELVKQRKGKYEILLLCHTVMNKPPKTDVILEIFSSSR